MVLHGKKCNYIMKKIAVLLPVYKNDSIDFLYKSIRSILSQGNVFFHVFIGVDGPVGDELRKALENIAEDKRVEIIWFETNRGLACVLNDLVALSKESGHDYYARMDADDIALPDRFEKQVKFLEDNTEVDVVGGAIEEIDAAAEQCSKLAERMQAIRTPQAVF